MAVENVKIIQVKAKLPDGRTVLKTFRTDDDPAQIDVQIANADTAWTVNTAPAQVPPDYYTEDQKDHF